MRGIPSNIIEQSPASDLGLRIGHRRNILRSSFYGNQQPITITEKVSPRESNKIKVDDIEQSPTKMLSHKSNRVTYLQSATEKKAMRKAILSPATAPKGANAGSGVIYDALIQTHDLGKFFDRMKALPQPNQMIICHEKIKFQQRILQEYFEEIEYQNELNDRFLSMMTHLQKEFISGEVDSEEEMRELKRQLAIKVNKFENEIRRARWTFDNIRETLERGTLVAISETNYAIFDETVN